MKVVRPAGTVISFGSQALPWIVTVTAWSTALGGALRASFEAYQKAARPATTSSAEAPTATRMSVDDEEGEEEDIGEKDQPAVAVRGAAAAAGRRKKNRATARKAR
ncbi:hypothetical protein D9M68_550600 [compost metagenome]